MGTSNSINFNQTRDEISSDALRLLGIITKGETANANDLSFCSNQLNKMIKGWEAKGVHVWAQSEALIPLVDGFNEYIIDGTTANDVGGDLAHNTTLSADASGSSITVTDATWANVSDYVVITLDDGSRQTTTITAITDSTLTLTDALDSDAASGNNVVIFTKLLNRPINITSARYRYNSGIDRVMEIYSRAQFMALPNKSAEGPPTCLFYSPQLNNGRLYLWPTPTDSNDMLDISYQRTLEDFDAAGDNPDLPQEWLECITYNLAVRIAPSFGISLAKSNPEIIQIAQEAMMDLQSWDFEEGSISIVPSYRYDN